VASSGDNGGNSNGKESVREKGASSSREEGERSSACIYREREGRGEVAGEREEEAVGALQGAIDGVGINGGQWGGRNGRVEAPLLRGEEWARVARGRARGVGSWRLGREAASWRRENGPRSGRGASAGAGLGAGRRGCVLAAGGEGDARGARGLDPRDQGTVEQGGARRGVLGP
jgi:hypothetical protein